MSMTEVKASNIPENEKHNFEWNAKKLGLTMTKAIRQYLLTFNKYPQLSKEFIYNPEKFLKTN